jgi:ubiquinone/menaquinone biosynthesis C-methylase UbiE
MPADPAAFTARVVALFDHIAATYDDALARFYPFAADRLILRLNPQPGDKILDAGTGTGHAALAAAQAVSPGGRVLAIDLSPAMLARFDAKISKFGTTNIDVFEMDAAAPEFRAGYFQHVVASHTLYCLPDIDAALGAWRRALQPGGTLAMASFGAKAFQPLLDRMLAALERHDIALADDDHPLCRRGLTTVDDCRARLERAGFESVETHVEQLGFHLKDGSQWWELVEKSELRRLLERVPHAVCEAVREQLLTEFAELKTENGLWLDAETIFTLGRKPTTS